MLFRSHATAALRQARAGLALHGQRVESLLVNRLVPAGSGPDGGEPFLAGLHREQQRQLDALRAEWDVPVHGVPHLGPEPEGADRLAALGLPPVGPSGSLPAPWPVEDLREGDEGALVWRIPLPGADRADLDLVRRGDDLVLGVGPYRRTVALPSALRRCTVAGAALREGVLAVRFTPDPALWPGGR